MPANTTTLGEFLDQTGGSLKTGPFGTKLKASEYTETGVPVVSVGEVGFGRLKIHDDTPRVDASVWDRMPEYLLKTGDVVFGRKGAVERSAYIRDEEDGYFLGSDGIRVRLNDQKCDPLFIAYQFQSPAHRAWMIQNAAGTTMPSLNEGIIRRIPIVLKPLPEQKAIARILGTLDDKIELNRRMNATLEAMARALFQSWFVDAVPDDASLPEGWEMSTIGAEAKVVGGSTPSTKSTEFWNNGEFHWVTPKDFSSLQSKVLIGSSRKVTKAGLDQISSGLLPENTVLLSSRAPVGYLALTKIKTAINQGFIAMICHGRLSPEYVMLWADSIMDQIKQAASGTTFAEISKATFRPFPIIVPSADRLKQFTDIVRAFYERIAANERQSVTLAETRDTLLPKFLSGELRTEEVANAG